MKKRVLSALLVLCLACGLVSTAWATGGAGAASKPAAATETENVVSVTPATPESGEAESDSASWPARTEEQTVPGTDVTVQVSVPAGALPENAKLTTALVGSSEDDADDQAVADVADELDKANVEYDGFVALDISFVDADGNKVEPLQPVSVNFTLPAELLPEDVDASTLEVQHLEENAAGEVENVETVADTADATEGTVTVDGAAATLSEDADTALPADAQVTAEFTVDGFSRFTLTYTYGVQLTIQVVDTDNKGIGQNGSSTIGTSWESVQDIADKIVAQNHIPDEYAFDHAEIREYSGSPTEIYWLKYYQSSSWFGNSGFRYSTNENQPTGSGNSLNNATVYFVFVKNGSGGSGEGGESQKDSINWGNLPNPNTTNTKTTVNFYLNLYSKIANSDQAGGGSAVNKDNFTTSVLTTSVSKYPASFEYTRELDENGGLAAYVVIQGNTNGSAYEADAEIRTLETGSTQGFTLADFPTDAEVFTKIRNNWYTYTKGNGIEITQSDGTVKEVQPEELTTDNYTIRWYVFKYNLSDAWHVDGILVPKYGRLTVTKTFDFGTAETKTENELLSLVPSDFNITVSSSENSYRLRMAQSTPTDSLNTPGWSNRTVDAAQGTVTYTWEVDVFDATYTIKENNYTNVDGYSFGNATYTTTPHNGTQSASSVYSGNGFTIECVTSETDQEDTARQSASLSNTYTKSVGSLEITKAVEGLPDNLANTQSFTFTITPSAGLTVNWDAVSATDGSSQPVTITKTEKGAKVTLTGEGTVTIQNLPLGSYTVDEETPQGLSDYSYDRNEFSPQNKTVEVKANQPGKITVTNHYSEYKSLTLKKMVAGNMTVASDTFSFMISGIGADQVNKQDSSITVEESNGNVIVTMKGDQSVELEKLTDEDQITITESDSGNGYTPSIDLSDVAGYSKEGNTVSHTGFTTSGTNSVTVDVDKVSASSSDLGLIVFINTRNIPTPTGLESNHTTPYTIMITVAGIAGLALIGGIVARRVRRRREE